MKTYKLKNRIKQRLYKPTKSKIITAAVIKNINDIENILEKKDIK